LSKKLNTQPYFKHETRGRWDEGINTLEGLGYRDAYRHWFSLLEIAVEENAHKSDGKFKINERTLAKELRVKPKKLEKLLTTYALHLALVCHRKCVEVPHICHTCTTHKQYVWIITISNLLSRTENRGKKGIYKRREEKSVLKPFNEEEEIKADKIGIDNIYKIAPAGEKEESCDTN